MTNETNRPNKRNDFWQYTDLNLAVTNAQSVAPKIESVIECFECLKLDYMAVTETWLLRDL